MASRGNGHAAWPRKVKASAGVMYDLGCGGFKQPGAVGVDIRPGPSVDIVCTGSSAAATTPVSRPVGQSSVGNWRDCTHEGPPDGQHLLLAARQVTRALAAALAQ